MPFGDYEINLSEENKLGKGHFGNVYKINRKDDKKEFAVKIISTITINTKDIDQVKKEAEIQQGLDHPNIVKIVDYFLQEQEFYIVVDLYKQDLSRIISQKNDQSLKYELVLKIFTQLIQILGYLQDQNVIHRDIKPQNLLVDVDLNIYLTDFGIARTNSHTSTYTKYKGTEVYMAPELFEETIHYEHQPDVWAAGIILYELMTKCSPFKDHIEVMKFNYILNLDQYDDPSNLKRFFKLIFVPYDQRISAQNILFKLNSYKEIEFGDPYSKKYYDELCLRFDKIDLNFVIFQMQHAIKTEKNKSRDELERQNQRIQQSNSHMDITKQDIDKIRRIALCI